MAVQKYMVGIAFCIGIVAGLVFQVLYSVSLVGSPAALSMVSTTDRGPRGFTYRPPLSHEEVEEVNKQSHLTSPIEFKDNHQHQDNDNVAQTLAKKVRVLCWIMTAPENLQTKAIHVKTTWGKRCNKLLFISDKDDADFPAVGVDVPHGRDHLTAKTMKAFDYIYRHHIDDADWFLKADDDTYVIVENLRYLLSAHRPNESVYFGHHFKTIVPQGYFSGGAGYVLSRQALSKFGARPEHSCREDYGAEDAEMGWCMEKLKIKTGDSRDRLGRSRFHCFNPGTHLHGGYPDWYRQYDKYGAHFGIEAMSDYAISFHYVTTQEMYDLEYYIYHLRPYGIVSGLQDLNPVNGDNLPEISTTTTTTKRFTTTTATTSHAPSERSSGNRISSHRGAPQDGGASHAQQEVVAPAEKADSSAAGHNDSAGENSIGGQSNEIGAVSAEELHAQIDKLPDGAFQDKIRNLANQGKLHFKEGQFIIHDDDHEHEQTNS